MLGLLAFLTWHWRYVRGQGSIRTYEQKHGKGEAYTPIVAALDGRDRLIHMSALDGGILLSGRSMI